jgi:hypothetical protein
MPLARASVPFSSAASSVPADGSVTDIKVASGAAISADKLADGTTYKLFLLAERTKLAGIAVGATANSADATLLDRSNHTGVQSISTVSGLQAALDARATYYVVHNVVSASSYSFVLADATRLTEATSGASQTYTIPANASVAFPVGSILEVVRHGAGSLTLAAASGVTIRTPSSLTARAQYSTIVARQRAVNEWVLSGDLT